MTPAPPRVHDLLRIGSADQLVDAAGEDRPPAWFDPDPVAPIWVVVRRTSAGDRVVDVGVRGASRGERWAATVRRGDIAEHVPPPSVPRGRGSDRPAIAALTAITSAADRFWPGVWGPAGSVGYELVTGSPVVKDTSDLVLVLYADAPLDRASTARTLGELRRHAGSVRIDLIVETPGGGFAANEWLADPLGSLALRTPNGPVLTDDPWRTA